MSLDEFWTNVMRGEALREPMLVHEVSSPSKPPYALQLDLWLTPRSVEGFEPRDFWFLPVEELEELRRAVESFRDVACQVSPRLSASEDQARAAASEFDAILRILDPAHHEDATQYKVDKILGVIKQDLQQRGHPVEEIRYRIEEEDGSDAMALWILVIVPDEFAESPDFLDRVEQIRVALQRKLESSGTLSGLAYWPHVRFRTASEQEELEAEGGDWL